MVSLQQITRYFEASLAFRIQPAVELKEPYWEASREELETGFLNPIVAQDLRKKVKESQTKLEDGQPVKVVISLVTLRVPSSSGGNQNKHQGLLLLPALVFETGELSFDAKAAHAWIPHERLNFGQQQPMDVYVCQLSHYREQYRRLQTKRDNVETWRDWLDTAWALFDAVNQIQKEDVEAVEGELIARNIAFVMPYELTNATNQLKEVYSALNRNIGNEPALYATIVQSGCVQQHVDRLKTFEARLDAALRNCGHVSPTFPLAPSQRIAVNGFTSLGQGEVCAVSGPPGTGKTTTLQGIIANMIVSYALEKRDAPLIVGTSSNNQAVTNIIDSFSKIASNSDDSLIGRWLPMLQTHGDGTNQNKPEDSFQKPLQGISVYFPSSSKREGAEEKGLAVESASKKKWCLYQIFKHGR